MAIDDEPIIWSGFYQAYTGLRFSIKKDDCKVFVPNYKNLFHVNNPPLSGTEMGFKDEWSNQAFMVAGSTDHVDEVLLRDLWEYAENNILWDDFKEKLSFKDIEVDEVNLEDFVKDLDEFLVFHKLTKFGNVWWHKRVVCDMEGDASRNINVYVPNLSSGQLAPGASEIIKFWSADKFLNDEYKKYLSNPTFYNGFFTSEEFNNGGWFTVPDLTISTKPFEKLKIAHVLLNLNFTFDPRKFGQYYAIDSTLGGRIKDLTSDTVLDTAQAKTGQNESSYSDSLITNWIGGLVSTENLQTLGPVGEYVQADGCTDPEVAPTPTEISHSIGAQISLNPDFNPNHKDALGTIDPINWRSSELENNSHNIGVLNTDRAFGAANGTIDGGLVFGGVQNDSLPKVLQTVEIWDGTGFLKNVQTQANAPRCFHVQGGTGETSLVALGGYTRFNTTDAQQFGEYGKAGVRNDLEVFIKSDDPLLSYFKAIPTFKLNTQRGDFAGALSVSTKDRQDKFEATDALKSIPTGKDDEQRIATFIKTQSGSIDNDKRYSVISIQGIAYNGSSSGKSYLTSTASTDILDSFERINTVFVDVGVSNTNIAIAYATKDPNLTYPVPCHGLNYVGNEKSGLSTGGRCEKNTIDEVEARLIEKYTTGYKIDIDLDEDQSSLLKSRVLDLVYAYDGITWTRKQNLLESVYYHCGVGDENHAIFWGGIHDSLADYLFVVSDAPSSIPSFGDWDCEGSRTILTESIVNQGKSYTPMNSTCWTSPASWQSISALLLFDNPEYKQGSATLSFGRDAEFPPLNVYKLYPSTTKTFGSSPAYSSSGFDYPNTTSVAASATFISGASFQVESNTLNGIGGIVRGTWNVGTLIANFDNQHIIYPESTDIVPFSIGGETKLFEVKKISLSGTSVLFNYRLKHTFNYDSVSLGPSQSFQLSGNGILTYSSLTDIWNNGVVPNVFIETASNQLTATSTMSENPTDLLEFSGTGSIYFGMADQDGVLIGVRTSTNTWSASFEACAGNGVADYLNITATIGSGNDERWGVPLWSAGFDISASFGLVYGFDVYDEQSDGNIGLLDHEITTVHASAGSLAAILSNRVLITGNTKEQIHSYDAMNAATVPTISASCETLLTNSLSISIPITSSEGFAYTEYATSFIQEYRDDSRYKIPEKWIPTNGFSIRPENTGTLFKSSDWKRYMDGVGLGGDAPNYDAIFNTNSKKVNLVSDWDQIGKYHVGQMAFGTPERSVVVGGHTINKDAWKTSGGGGIHAGPTTKRIFLWDFITIPEEDSYLTNYLGRRFHTFYVNESGTLPISSNNNSSDLNCIIFNAESDKVVERFGTAVFDGSSDSVSVTFDDAMPDQVGANYSICLTPSDNVEAWWSEKTAGGFTIKIELKEWKGQIDYLATTIIKVTEEDINKKDELDGYIF
jgi:hypothetical protein